MNTTEKRTLVKLVKRQAVDAINAHTDSVVQAIRKASPHGETVTKTQFKKDAKALKAAKAATDEARKAWDEASDAEQDLVTKLSEARYGRNLIRFPMAKRDYGSRYQKDANVDQWYDYYLEELQNQSRWRADTNKFKLNGHLVHYVSRAEYNDLPEVREILLAHREAIEAAKKFLDIDVEAEVILGGDKTAQEMMDKLNDRLNEILS